MAWPRPQAHGRMLHAHHIAWDNKRKKRGRGTDGRTNEEGRGGMDKPGTGGRGRCAGQGLDLEPPSHACADQVRRHRRKMNCLFCAAVFSFLPPRLRSLNRLETLSFNSATGNTTRLTFDCNCDEEVTPQVWLRRRKSILSSRLLPLEVWFLTISRKESMSPPLHR